MAKNNTSNICIRMDSKVKSEADALFESLGMNISTAFNIFVRQCLREEGIPFEITAACNPNARTKAAMIEAERISNDPDSKGYTDIDELFKDLKS